VALAAATRPSYPVRDLRGHTLAEARRLVGGKEGFSVVEAKGTFYREAEEVGRIIGQSPLPEERLKEGRTIRVQLSDGPAPRTVPDLAGRPRAEVQQLLDGVQLVLSPIDQNHDTIAKDTVVDWSPKATLPRGGTVTVVFSKGPEPKPLPSFADRLYDEYVKALEALGLKAKKEEAFSDRVKSGVVITTNPSGIAVPGSEVTVVVSKGPEQVEVPTLSGLSEDDAAARLQQAGLRLGDRFGPPNKKVFASSPSGGTKVEKGSSVDVYTR
jgi:serine/threonine-protein kinase